MSISKENFIKTAFQLKHDDKERVTGSRMAARLNVSGAAITDMARKLDVDGLIQYEKYQEFVLTDDGVKLAVDIIRKHRLWETFLVRILDLPWDEVHREAELLEHATSEALIDEIDAFLGFPDFDPHGDPIPSKNGKFPEPGESHLLSHCDPGYYTISRVRHRTDELASFFTNNNFYLGTAIQLIDRMKEDESVIVKIESDRMILSKHIASNIYVQVNR